MSRKVTTIEWAFRAKAYGYGYVKDVEVFNKDNCNWPDPIEDWDKIILSGYIFDYAKRKYGRSLKLVKRTTETETVWRNTK